MIKRVVFWWAFVNVVSPMSQICIAVKPCHPSRLAVWRVLICRVAWVTSRITHVSAAQAPIVVDQANSRACCLSAAFTSPWNSG